MWLRITTLFLIFQCLSWPTLAEDASSLLKNSKFDRAFREAYLGIYAEEQGDASDYLVIGKIYLNGFGTSRKDTILGIKYISDSIQLGSDQAILYLAQQYDLGKVVDRNVPNALKYYQLAKESGKTGLETKIASLAKELSSGEMTTTSCKAAIEASYAEKSDFYIFAAKCLADSGKSVEMATKWLVQKFENGSNHESLEAIAQLADRNSPLFSSILVARLALAEKNRKNKSVETLQKIDLLVSDLTFEASDCSQSIEQKESRLAEVVCGFVIANGDTTELLEIDETIDKFEDPGKGSFEKRVSILVKILPHSKEAQNRLNAIAGRVSSNGTKKETSSLLMVYLDHTQFLDNVHTMSARLFTRAASFDNFNGDFFLKKMLKNLYEKGSPSSLENVLLIIFNEASSNKRLNEDLIYLVRTIIDGGDQISSNIAVDFAAQKMAPKVGSETALAFFLQILEDQKLSNQTQKKIGLVLNALNSEVLNSLQGDKNSILKKAEHQRKLGNCGFIERIFDDEIFDLGFSAYMGQRQSKKACIHGNLDLIADGLQGYPNRSTGASRKYLKTLCGEKILNACFALGVSYYQNYGSELGKREALDTAALTLERNLDNGHLESAVILTAVYKDANKKEEALKMADKAYKSGFADALYLKAEMMLSNIFSGKKACRPLLRFISESSEKSQYWEAAIRLKSKKCKT